MADKGRRRASVWGVVVASAFVVALLGLGVGTSAVGASTQPIDTGGAQEGQSPADSWSVPVDGDGSLPADGRNESATDGNESLGDGNESVGPDEAPESTGKGDPIPEVGNITVPAVRAWRTNVSGPGYTEVTSAARTPNGGVIVAEKVGASGPNDDSGHGQVTAVGPTGEVVGRDAWRDLSDVGGVARLGGGGYVAVGTEDVPLEFPADCGPPRAPGVLIKGDRKSVV